jgi:hypothetical protein
MHKYTKRDATGQVLPAFAEQWAFVVDESTGLMWHAEDSNAKAVTFQGAEKTIASLNAAKQGGFGDWRLPTVQELLSLVDYTKVNPAIDTAFFRNVDTDSWYWTSTPAAASPADCAWLVTFLDGYSGWGYRGYSYRVRAVRSVSRASQ